MQWVNSREYRDKVRVLLCIGRFDLPNANVKVYSADFSAPG